MTVLSKYCFRSSPGGLSGNWQPFLYTAATEWDELCALCPLFNCQCTLPVKGPLLLAVFDMEILRATLFSYLCCGVVTSLASE